MASWVTTMSGSSDRCPSVFAAIVGGEGGTVVEGSCGLYTNIKTCSEQHTPLSCSDSPVKQSVLRCRNVSGTSTVVVIVGLGK